MDALNDLVDELLCPHVDHPAGRIPLDQRVRDRLHQVGLPKPGSTVDEERVVGLARGFGYGVCCGCGEFVGLPDNEGLERVPMIEGRGHPGRTAGGSRRRRHEEIHLRSLGPLRLHLEHHI